MRKIITYLLLSYGIITASFAQQDSTLLLLDKTEITTGVLYPYLTNDINALWLKYDGITDTIANIRRWKQLYAEYVYYNLEPSLLPTVDSITKKVEYEINYNERVPLMIMDIDYHAFKSHAIDSGLVIIENGKFMDNPDRTESPYIEKQLFVAAPFMEKMMNDTLTFFISSDFYFSSSSLPQTIEIDFGDGVGFRSIAMEQTIKINYSAIKNAQQNTSFSPIIIIKVSKGSNNLLSSSTMKASTCLGSFPPQDDIWNLYVNQPFYTNFPNPYPVDPLAGNFARANAYVKYGNGHPKFEVHKPIVFVEGIDFGRDFSSNTIQNGDFGWCAFWGQDFDPNDPDEGFPEFRDAPILLNQLLANGYDVFLLDFRDGAEFIERNAMALVELLRLIRLNNQFNNINVVPEPTVVVGASMGGQVARYALAYMEKNNIQHCAREFISFDSPHQGANIPISLQKWIDFFANNGGGNQGAKDNLNFKLDRPATKQLLLFHYKGVGGGFNTLERAAYNNAINVIGYPKKTRNVAIANGSGHSVKQPNLNPGDLLLKTDWSPTGCLNAKLLRGDCYAIPNFLIFSGTVPKSNLNALSLCLVLTSPFFCNLCINNSIHFDNQTDAGSSSLRALDNAPGGWRNTAKTIAKEFRKDPPPTILGSSATIDENPQSRPGGSPNQAFIPTISALDINTTNLLFNAFNIQGLLPDQNITPFEAFYIPTNQQNQKHVQLDPSLGGNMEWAINEILNSENKLKSPLTNASPNNGVFNYGRKDSRFISSVIIGNGGQLHVNANLPTDYGLATTPIPSTGVNPPAAGSSLLMETCDCGEVVVEIDAGGEFILGENTPNNKATVLFHKGSTLRIKTGGKLIIKNNSRLVIEKGAKLIYEPGAEIQLLGDEAVLEIQGELEIKDNATFTFTFPNNNSGYLKFNVPFNPCQSNPNWPCPVISAGQNSNMELKGADKNDKILEIAGEDMLIPEDMAFFRLWLGKAEFTKLGARLSIASTNYQLVDATFVGTVNNRGVVVWGNSASIIARCTFDNVKLRGDLYAAGNRLNVINSNFTNGANVETNGRGVFFSNVDFDRLSPTPTSFNGWFYNNLDFPSVYTKGNIVSNNGIGSGMGGGTFSSIALNEVIIKEGSIAQGGGVLMLKCSEVTNSLINQVGDGILYEDIQLRMSSIDGNGFNKITGNAYNINGFYTDLLDIELGFNDFSNGHITVGFFPPFPTSIGGSTNQYYAGAGIGAGTPNPNTINETYPLTLTNTPKVAFYDQGSPQCVYNPLIPTCPKIPLFWEFLPSPLPTPPCNNTGGGGISNPTGTISALKLCPTCPVVNSANFSNVPLNEAIEIASSFMELTDTMQNDISAVALFHEIFTTTPIDFNDYNQVFLLKYGYSNMKNALQHCFVTGRLNENSCVPVLHNSVEQFMEVINIRKAPVSAQNVAEQFFLELDEALVFRLIGQRDEAIIQLEAIDNCFLTQRHRQILKNTIATTKVERDVINGTVPLMAAIDLMDAIPRLEIKSNASVIDTTATIHPTAIIGTNVTIGSNVMIEQDVVIGSNTVIANNVIIKKNSIIGEDVIIEENTLIEKEVEIGNFTAIGSYTIIKQNTTIGEHTTINDSIVIEKDVTIYDYVDIETNVLIKKETTIGNGVFIGKNAIISKEITIGELAIIRENAEINDKVKVGNKNIIAKAAKVKNNTETGKEVLVEENVHVPANKEICDNENVTSNFNFSNVCATNISPPVLVSNTNSCAFAMGYAQTRTNFLNGFQLGSDAKLVTDEVIAFIPDNLSSFYNWEFGDCGTSTDEQVIYTFRKPGIYLVKLTQGTTCDTVVYYGAVTVFPNPKSEISPIVPQCLADEDVKLNRATTIDLSQPSCIPTADCTPFIPLKEENCRLKLIWDFDNDSTKEETIALNDTNLINGNIAVQYDTNNVFIPSLITSIENREETHFKWEKACEKDTATAEITITNSFKVSMAATGCASGEVQFTSTTFGGVSPFTYSWVFGNGLIASTSSPLITVADTGMLSVELMITDANGCESHLLSAIYISDCNANARTSGNANAENTADGNNKTTLTVNDEIKVYPNPTAGQVTFEYSLKENNAQIIITDVMGKVVSSVKINGDNRTKIDLSNFPKGVYLYKVIGQTKVILSDKIILME